MQKARHHRKKFGFNLLVIPEIKLNIFPDHIDEFIGGDNQRRIWVEFVTAAVL